MHEFDLFKPEQLSQQAASNQIERGRMKNILVLGIVLLVSSCVYTPKRVSVYDEECHIMVKHMELEPTQVISLTGCKNEQCYANILGAGAISAGSVIISGSIVITANLVYWFEKQSQCH